MLLGIEDWWVLPFGGVLSNMDIKILWDAAIRSLT